MDQQTKDLEYLRHCHLNSLAIIQGCFKHIEEQLRFMTEAMNVYTRSLERERPPAHRACGPEGEP